MPQFHADCVHFVVSYIMVWCCGILARHQHFKCNLQFGWEENCVLCAFCFVFSVCTTSRDQWDDAPRSPLSYCGIPYSCECSRSIGNQWLQTSCSFVLDSSWREGDSTEEHCKSFQLPHEPLIGLWSMAAEGSYLMTFRNSDSAPFSFRVP